MKITIDTEKKTIELHTTQPIATVLADIDRVVKDMNKYKLVPSSKVNIPVKTSIDTSPVTVPLEQNGIRYCGTVDTGEEVKAVFTDEKGALIEKRIL